MSFKRAGSPVYRLGTTPRTLGGSAVAEILGIGARAAGAVPAIDYAALRAEIGALLAAHDAGFVLAAHDVSDGGTLVALAEMAFAADCTIGAQLECEPTLHGAFAESGSFVVEAADGAAFEALCRAHGAPFERLATTIAEGVLRGPGGFECALRDLYEAWSAPLRDFYADAVAETSG